MDLDKAFVAALLIVGIDGLKAAQAKGVSADMLQDDGRRTYDFVIDYFQRYNGFPSVDAVEGKLGITLDDPSLPIEFLADEIINRQLHTRLSNTYQDGVKHLEMNDPQAALAVTETSLYELRRDQLTAARVVPFATLGDAAIEFYRKVKAGERGILTPWENLNNATFGFWPEDFVLFAARTGVGKCVESGTTLQDPKTGLVRTIEELHNDPSWERVTTWSKEEGVHVRPITAKHYTGRKTCLKFSLGTGRSVSVTPEHPFLTPEGWTRADALKPGCTVGLSAKMPFPSEPADLPQHEIDFIAIMLADGSCTMSTPRFTKRDEDVIALAETAASRLGIELKHTKRRKDYDFVGKNSVGLNPAMNLLKFHGMSGVLSKNKMIPDAVFRLPGASLARFLAVFWICDGYEELGTVCITLASEKMIQQLQHLFLRFGIQSSVSYKKAKCRTGEFYAWVLRIYSQCVPTFLEKIPAFGEKMSLLQAASSAKRRKNVGFPRVSEELMLQIKAEAGEVKGRWTDPKRMATNRRVAGRLGWKWFAPRDLFKKHGDQYAVPLNALRVYVEEFGCVEKYKWLWDSEVFWDVVEDIEDIGEQKIYDLTVEPTSCFVADDVIVHNTWTALILAHYAWTQGHKVLFVSTEMAQLGLGIRWAALHNKLSYYEFRHGMLSTADEIKLVEGVEAAKKVPGFDVVGGDFDFQIETLDVAIAEAKPDLVVADGANLFKSDGSNRTEKAANSFDEFKRVAKRRSVPVLLTTQFNREVKSGSKPGEMKAEKIALSDAAGWNADQIYALYQTEEMRSDKRMGFHPMKCREGVVEDWEIRWDLDRMQFEQLTSKGNKGDATEDDDYGTGVGTDPSSVKDTDDVPF